MIGDINLYTARFSQFLKRSDSHARAANAGVEKFFGVEGPGLTAPGAGTGAAAGQLTALIDDIALYVRELREGGGVPSAAVQARLAEVDELRHSVEAFAAAQGLALQPVPAAVPAELIAALRAAAEPLPQPPAGPHALCVSAEVEEAGAERLGRRLRTAAAKLEALELLIGGRAPFQAKSVCLAVQEELRATAYLDPAAATDVLRRLELVADEVGRQANDRRMNYFTQQQKQELARFFAEFREAQEEFAAGAESNPVSAAVDALEASQPLLQRAVAHFSEGRDLAEALGQLRREAEENGAALAALQAQMAENCALLEENLRLLSA